MRVIVVNGVKRLADLAPGTVLKHKTGACRAKAIKPWLPEQATANYWCEILESDGTNNCPPAGTVIEGVYFTAHDWIVEGTN